MRFVLQVTLHEMHFMNHELLHAQGQMKWHKNETEQLFSVQHFCTIFFFVGAVVIAFLWLPLEAYDENRNVD